MKKEFKILLNFIKYMGVLILKNLLNHKFLIKIEFLLLFNGFYELLKKIKIILIPEKKTVSLKICNSLFI